MLPNKSLQAVIFVNKLGWEDLVAVLVWGVVILEEVVAHVQEAEVFEPHTLKFSMMFRLSNYLLPDLRMFEKSKSSQMLRKRLF